MARRQVTRRTRTACPARQLPEGARRIWSRNATSLRASLFTHRYIYFAGTLLASLTHSARIGSGQGSLGGGAISLYCSMGGSMRRSDWRCLDLDGALLARSDLSGSDLRTSALRGADLSLTDLTNADLRGSDLTDANLDAGGSIIALSADVTPHRYICLTEESALGRIVVDADGSLRFFFIPLPLSLRWPENLFILAEDLVLITAHSEFLIVEIGSGTAEEVAHFRISSDFRSTAVVGQKFLGMLFESEWGANEALLVDIDSGQVVWRIRVAPHGGACGWSADGVLIAYNTDVVFYHADGTVSTIRTNLQPSGRIMTVDGDIAVAVTYDGQAVWLQIDGPTGTESVSVHSGAGTAVVAAEGDVLSAGSDGSLALIRQDGTGEPVVASRLERRLRCSGARVEGLKGNQERLIFLANGAVDT